MEAIEANSTATYSARSLYEVKTRCVETIEMMSDRIQDAENIRRSACVWSIRGTELTIASLRRTLNLLTRVMNETVTDAGAAALEHRRINSMEAANYFWRTHGCQSH